MLILSHPGGNPNVRAALRTLAAAGLLEAFYTTIALSDRLVDLAPRALRAELQRRAFNELPRDRIGTLPWREAVRLLATRAGLRPLVRHEAGWAAPDAVFQAFDRHVAARIRRGRTTASAVYAYEDAALQTFRAARERGLARFYDLPAPYWRTVQRITREERERQPAWAATLDALRDSAAKLARKDEELALSERVIVASGFARRSLADCPDLRAPVAVVPYGAPPAAAPRARPPAAERPLRVLYVGRMVQAKGLSYLLDAVARLGRLVTLTLVGARPDAPCPPLDRALERHDWLGAIPHARTLELMTQHHVLVFPSLADGFGLVILEALSCAMPVIASINTGGPDVLQDGVDGFVVPIRDADAIAERLVLLADDPDRLAAMGEAARATAQRLSWELYGQRLLAALGPLCASG